MKWTGLQTALSAFGLATDKIDAIVRTSLEEMAYEVLGHAKKQVPVDTGNLRSSGEIKEIDDGFVITFTADYAKKVHEQTEVEHTNGKAKFLEDAIEVIIDKAYAQEVIVGRINEELNLS